MLRRFTQFCQAFGLVIVLGLSLSGCALEKVVFERLDWFAMYQIDSYLDLDRDQKIKLKPTVSDAIVWLKREQVPSAINKLASLEASARSHTYNEEVSRTFTHEIDVVRKELFTKYEQPIVDLFLSLTKDQFKYIAKKMKKSNEDLEDVLEDKDDATAYDAILKKQKKTLKEYYGALSDEQEKSFYSTMRLSRPDIERRLAERRKIQAYILETLESKDRVRIVTMLQSFRDTGEIFQDKAYIEYRQAAEKRWESYLVAFHKSLSNQQWFHLEGKLKDMRKSLSNMIGVEFKS